MSSDAMWNVMRRSFGDPARKLLLMVMADGADDQGRGAASYDRVAAMSDLSRDGLLSMLGEMESAFLLRWRPHPEDEGKFIFQFNYSHESFGRTV